MQATKPRGILVANDIGEFGWLECDVNKLAVQWE